MKRRVVAAVLVWMGCEAPDSSGLFRPAGDSLRTETPSIGTSPGAVDAGSAGESTGAGGSPTLAPSAESPAAAGMPGSAAEEPAPELPPLDPPAPAPAPLDAGASSAPPLDAGSEPPPVAPACGGTLVDGVCWYLGDIDLACVDVCAERGGVDAASAAAVGTVEQGGSLQACTSILLALGALPEVVMEGFRDDGLGFGCHLFVDAAGVASAWWLTAPAFSPAALAPGIRLVCGCAR